MEIKNIIIIGIILVSLICIMNTVYSINLYTENLTSLYGEEHSFNIKLEENNTGITNETVNITLINKNNQNKTYQVITDNNGNGSIPINLQIGQYTVISQYQDIYKYNTINILKSNTSYIVSEDFMEIYGEGLSFTGHLYDIYGENIKGMHILLNLTRLSNGLSKVYNSVTDYNGKYSLQINLAPGDYSVKSSFNGLNTSTLKYYASLDVLNKILVTREKEYLESGKISILDVLKYTGHVREYCIENGSLPKDIRTSTGFINIKEYIYLLTCTLENIRKNSTESINIRSVNLPVNSPINSIEGILSLDEILDINNRLNSFINSNNRLSNYVSTSIGDLSYENYGYLILSVLKYYADYKILPETFTVNTNIFYKMGYSENINGVTVTTLSWNSGGNLRTNNIIMRNIEETDLVSKVLDESLKGTVLLSFGEDTGKSVLIDAGVHGNELSSIAASFKLINTLSDMKLKGKVYVICDLCPYTGSTSTRYFNGVNLNSVANIEGTLSNNLVKLSKRLSINYLGDFHCTMPNGKPGKDTVFGSYSPTSESSLISEYISKETGVSKIIYSKAGVEYDGAVEDVLNILGIPSVTCEVLTPHGTIRPGSVDTSYNMMMSLIKYAGII